MCAEEEERNTFRCKECLGTVRRSQKLSLEQ